MAEAARSDESLFASAAEISPCDRGQFLDAACLDPAQRARIEALLASHEHGGSFLQKPPLQPVTIDHVPVVETAGSIIDRYKLLQQIGEGGFGVVYMAEQKEPVRRKVALKVIKLGMDSREIIARFEAERQALAMMDHPNIAKVFDAGTTEYGRPYFVMELVKGVPIAEFCDKNQLSARDRLNLFAQVCHAVQHAHQKGIIHRDLKPSNILVTLHDGKPVPKVIDFGVAKAINQELTEKTMFTAYGHMVGTPQYMSPEQAEMSGLDVDTRSDVYSLGVLLYELLTGTTPLEAKRLRSAGYAEMQRLIREEEAPRPSTRVSTLGEQLSVVARDRQCDPSRLSALLRGELDWIVLKALEKDRTRRYESATALAKDMQRYLQDEPVEACPPTLGYRLRKIIRKNRVAVFAALAIVIASLLAAAGQTVNLIRARTAEADAVEARMAESIQREETGKERDAALEAKREATRQRNDAIEAGKKLQLAQDDLRATQYGWDMQMMPYAWDAGNVSQALQLLNRHKSDLRHFEWHYWDRQLHAERRTFKFPTVDVEVSSLTVAPNGTQAASLMSAINVWVLSADGTRVLTSVPAADVRTTGGKPVDQLLKVWDLGTGKELLSHVLQRSQVRARISHAVFSTDGSRVAVSWGSDEFIVPNPDGSFNSNRRVRVLEIASGKTLLDYQEPKGDASHWNLSPDGKRFAVIVKGSAVRIVPPPIKVWDVDTGKELFTVHGDAGATFAPPFSADSKRIAAVAPGTERGTRQVKIWDTDTGREVKQWDFEGDAAPPLVFSPDGLRLAAVAKTIERGTVNGTAAVNVWDFATGKELCTFPLSAAAGGWWDRPQPFFNRDGTRLAVTLRQSGTLLGPETKVFDTVAKKELFSFTTKHVNDIAAFAPDGNRIAAAEGRLVLIRDASTGQVKQTYKGHLTRIMALTFRPDGRGLYAIESDGTMKEWDTQPNDTIAIDGPGRTGVGAAALSLDGRRLAIIAPPADERQQTVRVVDTGTGKDLYSLAVPATALEQMTHHLAFSADGRRLGLARAPRAGSSNPRLGKPTEKFAGDLTLWDVLTAKLVTTAELPTEPLSGFCLSPDGSRAAVALRGGEIGTIPKLIVCDAATGRTLCESKPMSIGPGISFSPDGKRVAGTVRLSILDLASISTAASATLKVWDAANGKELLSFDTKGVGDSPVWDREGTRIAIGLKDQLGMGILRIFDATSGMLLASVEDTAGPAGNRAIAAIAFSPDGKRIAAHLGGSVRTSRAEPEVKMWDAASGKELLSLKTQAAGADLAFSADGHRLIEAGYPLASFSRTPPPTRPITVRSWNATPRP